MKSLSKQPQASTFKAPSIDIKYSEWYCLKMLLYWFSLKIILQQISKHSVNTWYVAQLDSIPISTASHSFAFISLFIFTNQAIPFISEILSNLEACKPNCRSKQQLNIRERRNVTSHHIHFIQQNSARFLRILGIIWNK